MPLQQFHVIGYRSVRNLWLNLGQINVLVGPNGCGKTNLYRALYLLHMAAAGRLSQAMLEEGGMPSILWAGERSKGSVRMVFEIRLDDFIYELQCGLPSIQGSAFTLDPEIKEESVIFVKDGKKVSLLERGRTFVKARNAEGKKVAFPEGVSTSESIFSELREPHQFPAISVLRQELLSWRFYHHFRTDAESRLRKPQVSIRTPILHHDGRDLAAALQTIYEIGDGKGLEQAIQHAFPGAKLIIGSSGQGFSVALKMPEFQRAFQARELSDGTLHYFCLLAALLSPRSPALLAINEPETSIHPDLLEPLAQLIVQASRFSQLLITTHSETMAGHLARLGQIKPMVLEKVKGETHMVRSTVAG